MAKTKIFLSSDSVGLAGSFSDWMKVWEKGISKYNNLVSKNSELLGMEVISFPGQLDKFLPEIEKLSWHAGIHGRVGNEKLNDPLSTFKMRIFTQLTARESGIGKYLSQKHVDYWLVHSYRFWEKGVYEELEKHRQAEKRYFVENCASPGSFDSAISAVEKLGGDSVIMVDLVHLLKELYGNPEVMPKNYVHFTQKALEKVEEQLSVGRRMGFHLPVGSNKSDSFHMEDMYKNNELGVFEKFANLLSKYDKQIEVVVLENQQEGIIENLVLPKELVAYQSARNVWLVDVLSSVGIL